jgi:hypothetical protein
MQVVSIALLVVGVFGVVVGGLKFREQAEWEHWESKIMSIAILSGSVLLLSIGAVLLFFV